MGGEEGVWQNKQGEGVVAASAVCLSPWMHWPRIFCINFYMILNSNSDVHVHDMIVQQKRIDPEFASEMFTENKQNHYLLYINIHVVVFFFSLPHRMQDDEGTQRPAGFSKESRSDHAQQVSCWVQWVHY